MSAAVPRAPAALGLPSIRASIASLPDPGRRAAALEEHLCAVCASLVGASRASIAVDRPLIGWGLDSLSAVELAHRLEGDFGVEVPLPELLDGATIADLVDRVAASLADAEPALPEPLRDAPRPAAPAVELPLSWGQRGLWFLHCLAPQSGAYNVAVAAAVTGEVDRAALLRALATLCDRHPMLRTTFTSVDGEPVQRVHDRLLPEVLVLEEPEPAAALDESPHRRLESLAWRPFDLAAGPLVRLVLVLRARDRAELLFVAHHLVCDLWSLSLFLSELQAIYREETGGAPAVLAHPAGQYADFVRWQRQWLAGAAGQRQAAYWRARLAGAQGTLQLPTDRPRPAAPTYACAARQLTLPGSLWATLQQTARARASTPFAWMLAVFMALLHRHGGQDDLTIGSPAAGRGRPEWAGVIGYFVNPVALRADLAGDPEFAALLAQTQGTLTGALEHQDYPLALLAEELHGGGEVRSSSPLPVMLVFQRLPRFADPRLAGFALQEAGAELELGDLRLRSMALRERRSELDLLLGLAPVTMGLAVSLQFNTALFDAATIVRLLGQFARLLAASLNEPQARLSSFQLLDAGQRHQVLREWGATAGPAPEPVCLHQLVERRARRCGDRPALLWGESEVSYRELNGQANRLARRLRRLGVGPDEPVAVLCERCPDLVVWLLAVLKAGGAYVPLDPAYPPARLTAILADSRPVALIARAGLLGLLAPPLPPLLVPESEEPPLAEESAADLPAVAGAGNLAYLIYTSGSTGRPKGVAIEHHSAVELMAWSATAFSPRELAGVLAATSVCFDLSVFEIFAPLCHGGTIVLAADVLALAGPFAAAPRVTLINTVPSAMAELVRLGAVPPGAGTVVLAGEPLKPRLARQLHELGTVERVLNLYGPSEDTTYSTGATVEPWDDRLTAIGRPLAGKRAYVLDRTGLPALPGVPGELLLGGGGVARGYLGRSELTAERFVPDASSGVAGGRLYRTGDLARQGPAGDLEFLGRLDHQIKLRGFRIELGEIEAVLASHEAVREAVVASRRAPSGEQALVAYLALPAAGASAEDLARYVAARLPAPMVPAAFVLLPALPQTANGKVDRRALPLPHWGGGQTAAGDAPQGPVLPLLAQIWSDLLGIEGVGPNDNFFALGGHSLLGMQVLSRIRERLDVDLPVAALFEATTLGKLGERVERARSTVASARLPPLAPRPPGAPAPLSFAQERLWFLDQLEPGSALYNIAGALHLEGPLVVAALAASLAAIVARHQALRTRFATSAAGPPQALVDAGAPGLSTVDLAALPRERGEGELWRLLRQGARRAFALELGPLHVFRLIRLGPLEHALLLVLHHTVADGGSLTVLRRELTELYASAVARRAPRLPRLPVQYADYAVWQRGWLRGEILERELAYWCEHLDGAPAELGLAADRPRPAAPLHLGDTLRATFPGGLGERLNKLARDSGVTLFMALLAGWQALLGRYTGDSELVVGAPVGGRDRAEVEGLIGLFVNSLPLRFDLAGDPRVRTLLARVRATVLGAFDHRHAPFERIVEAMGQQRRRDSSPFFQVMLTFDDRPRSPVALPDLAVAEVPLDTGTAKFDLTLAFAAGERLLEAAIEYSRELFEPPTVARQLRHLEVLLAGMAAAPECRLSELPLLDGAERQQLLEWGPPRLLDGFGNLVPIGVPGEICVAADARSGDLGRYRPTGAIEHLGRLDRSPRARLRRPPGRLAMAAAVDAGPAGALEAELLLLWSEVLGMPALGVRDDFFISGGHSLLATRVLARVRASCGVDLPLRSLFEAPTVAAFGRLVEGALARRRERSAPPLLPAPRERPLPLSFAQQRLWFLEQLEPGRTAYHLAAGLALRGRLDRSALAAAFTEIVRRHEVLRTGFETIAGETCQRVLAAAPCALPVVDLAGLDAARREAECRQLGRAVAERPFDLAGGAPLRLVLCAEQADCHRLLFAMHHIAGDGWSMGILVRELAALYGTGIGPESGLGELPLQYGDYATWQRRSLHGELLEQQLAHWVERLADLPLSLELSSDRPVAPLGSNAGGRQPVRIGRDLLGRLDGLAGASRVTRHMLLLAVLELWLHRRSGARDLAVGSPVAGRDRLEVEGLIGCFVNTLALRARPASDLSFAELLREVRETALAAHLHRELPFEALVDRLAPQRDLGATPLFRVFFNLHSLPGPPRLAGLETELYEVPWERAMFDLALTVVETAPPAAPALAATLVYRTALWDRATAARMAAEIELLLAAVLHDPDGALASFDLLGAAVRQQLVVEWNAAAGEREPGLLQARFEAMAARCPASPALVFGGQETSYGKLAARSERLARALLGRGVGPEARVGVCLPRRPRLVAALLAVLRAGGAYLPLDPAYPSERLNFMLDDARPKVLIGERRLCARLVLPAGTELLDVDEAEAGAADAPAPLPRCAALPGNLAYLIYTSGSTGRPKAVAIEHGNAAHRLRWAGEAFGASELAGVLAATSVSFDLSVFEIFAPLSWGGTLILADNVLALPALPAAARVTLINTVPSLMAELVASGSPALPAGLCTVNLAGEALPASLVRRLRSLAPVRVCNLYGPSEDTTYSTLSEPRDGSAKPPAIGRPLAGTRLFLLDATARLAALGVPGEIHLGGAGQARGYFGRPETTAERFIPDAVSGAVGARLYRTGDLGCYRSDGEVEFLGRLDHQVKVHGVRVELGEVEAALRSRPGVREAVVLLRRAGEGGGGGRLVAYVVTDHEPAADLAELRASLRGSLPDAMVPAVVVGLAALPRLPNGKIDRAALPDAALPAGAGGAALGSPIAELLAGIWGEVLGGVEAGPDDDFFALGGHSLSALRVAAALRERLGIELPLRILFEHTRLADLARRLTALLTARNQLDRPPLTASRGPGTAPLSFAQERLWLLDRLSPGGTAYNVAVAADLTGRLAVAALAAALAAIATRQESLRTRFPLVAGAPVQEIVPGAPVAPRRIDLAALPPAAAAREAGRLAAGEAARPFSLATGPLWRATLLHLGRERWRLLLTLHHIVCDGWSLDLLLRELTAAYSDLAAGRAPALPPPAVQYGDFALWQRRWLTRATLDRLLAGWRSDVGPRLQPLDLAAGRYRPAAGGERGGNWPVTLGRPLGDALGMAARRASATPFMVLLAGFGSLLGRYAATTEPAVGAPIANRPAAEVEGLIGFFANILALPLDLAGDPTWEEVLGRVRRTTLAAYRYQDLPFEVLVAQLAPQRDLGRGPVQAVLALAGELPALCLPGVTARLSAIPNREAKFDLTLALQPLGGAYEGSLEYRRDLFDAATAGRLAGHFATLLAAALATPGAPLSRLSWLTPAERWQLRGEWNASAAGYPGERSLAALFAVQVARRPEAPAVVAAGEVLTYGHLDARANRLARALMRLGVGPESLVAVALDRSLDAIVALLAVVKAGAAYLPLDPDHPADRLRLLLAQSGASALVARHSFAGLAGAIPAVWIDRDARSIASQSATPFAAPSGGLDALAYVMYTSGSSGLPKGVAVPQRGIVRLVFGADYASFGHEQVFLQLAPLTFDAATFEIWGCLLHGGRLAVAPAGLLSLAELAATVSRHAVTTLWLTAGLFHQMADAALSGLAGVRQLLTGGDVVSPEHVRRAIERLPGCVVIDGYGPTEGTTFSCCHPIRRPPATSGTVPIGRPIANTRAHAVDPAGELVPIGLTGELLLGGDGLARGYWRRPDLTAERFVPDPFSTVPGGRLYRTGDAVRHLPSGELEFLGRLDGQVKLRGYRIEPGEIEAVARQHPGVREAAVVLVSAGGAGLADRRLVAFAVGHGEHPPTAEELRAFLAQRLPAYMVPSSLSLVAALPLTPNGKVDRKALAAREGQGPESAADDTGPLPRTVAEALLAEIVAEVLSLPRVGIHDDFFQLGGHSLLAAQLGARIHAAFGVDLPLREIFERPQVAALARLLEGGAAAAALPALLGGQREHPPRASFAQRRLWFLDQLEPGSAVYNLPVAIRLAGDLDRVALGAALAEVVRRHEALRTSVGVEAGDLVQRIAAPPRPGLLPVIDLAALPDPSRLREAERVTGEQARRPFDLSRGPLLRMALLALAPRRHLALVTIHHIVGDGWSMGVLVRELGALYAARRAGRPSPLPELPVQYADYAGWQRRLLTPARLDSLLAYWRRQIGSAPPALAMPTDRPRPAQAARRGAWLPLALPAPLLMRLRQLARGRSATLFMTLLAGFEALLGRYSGQDDFTLGTPVAGRARLDTEALIGFFVNTLVLRANLGGDPTPGELLGRVRETLLAAHAHQGIPFERLVEELNPERSAGLTPLFQVVFALDSTPRAPLDLPGLAAEPFGVETGTAKFDLTLALADDGLSGTLEYDVALFDRATARRILSHYRTLLDSLCSAPDLRLSRQTLLTPAELAAVRSEWNDRDARSYVLDRHLEPVPTGAHGELFVAGTGLPRGERDRPELTAGRYLPDPWSAEAGARMFRTGERVRRRHAGEIAVVGPVERQGSPVARAAAEHRAPQTPDEEQLAAIFAQVLGLPRVGCDDNFFALGGHSLMATQLMAQLGAAFGIDLPMRALFDGPTVAELARLVASRGGAEEPAPPVRIVRRPRGAESPLSASQLRQWILDRLDPGTPEYNIPAIVELRGALSSAALSAALDAVIRRHEVLRTAFYEIDGRPAQRILDRVPRSLQQVDLRALPAAAIRREADRLAEQESRLGFDLSRAPLLRGRLLRLGEDEHRLFLTIHHMVADGWSVGILVRELAHFYGAAKAGARADLPALAIQYADYAAWQHDHLRGEALAPLVAYWVGQLEGGDHLLPLPWDRPRPARPTRQAGQVRRVLPADLGAAVARLGQACGATVFMTLLAVFKGLLHRYTGDSDLLAGTYIAGRERQELAALIGFFVNTLVLRTEVSGRLDVHSLIGRVREVALGAYGHQELPFERVLDALTLQRERDRTPLFQVLCVLQNTPRVTYELPGVELRHLPVEHRHAPFDLALWFSEEQAELTALLEYAADRFAAATAERLLGAFMALLAGAVAEPARPLAELPLLSAAERQLVLMEWAHGSRAPAPQVGQHGLFRAQAARTPEAVAVVSGERHLSYRELDRRACRLARHLRRLGVGPEVAVGLSLERSPEMLVGVLGVLEAGGFYVPVDPAEPPERLAWLLADCGAAVLLTQGHLAATSPAALPRLLLDSPGEWLGAAPAVATGAGGDLGNLAYAIYTSGTTGEPKAVLVEHRSLVNYAMAGAAAFGIGPGDRVLQFASLSFDTSAEEIFPALAGGATLVLRPPGAPGAVPGFLSFCRDQGLTVLDLPTAYWHEIALDLAASPEPWPPAVRLLIIGGEQALAPRLRSWWSAVGSAPPRLVNTYGPTEATIVTTCCDLAPDDEGAGTSAGAIGSPVPNSRVEVLDPWLVPTPPGVAGELHIGGAGLARGYLGRPALTAERFLPDPWSELPGQRLYRTGDLVRHGPTGKLEFRGRVDHQVKIRGVRVETGEVAAALLRHPGVRDAVVVARRQAGEGASRLAAYWVPAGDSAPSAGELRAFVGRSLPAAMIPSWFVVLAALPLTRAGKLDRRALPAPGAGAVVSTRSASPPDGPVEEQLASVWAAVLDQQQVGRDDNFFELGGDSILAMQVVARAHRMGLQLDPRDLFAYQTIAELAQLCRLPPAGAAGGEVGTVHGPGREPLPPLRALGPPRPGEAPLTLAQERYYRHRHLEVRSAFTEPLLARLSGPLELAILGRGLAEVIRRHEALRTTFHDGAGEAVQRVNPPFAPRLPVIDLAALPPWRHEPEVRRITTAGAAAPFDCASLPLLRVRVVRLTPGEHLLLFLIHHLVFDGWSVWLLADELTTLYRAYQSATPPPLPSLPVQLADFAFWQRGVLAGERLQREQAYWRRRLQGAPVLDLSFGSRPPGTRGRATREPIEVGDELTAGLERLSRAAGVSLFMTLLAAFKLLLHQVTGERDLVVSTFFANRVQPEIARLIGNFFTPMLLRTVLDPAGDFRGLLQAVRATVLEAQEHADLAASELSPARVRFNLQDLPVLRDVAIPGVAVSWLPFDDGAIGCDLAILLRQSEGRVVGAFRFDREILDPAQVEGWRALYLSILEAVTRDPDLALTEIDGPVERQPRAPARR